MLHSLTKGSKKSFVAKAVCLTAGLVAVFASSSVLADSTPSQATPIRCAFKNGDDASQLRLKAGSAAGTFVFYDAGTTNPVDPSALNCTTASGDSVSMEPAAAGAVILMVLGERIFYLPLLYR